MPDLRHVLDGLSELAAAGVRVTDEPTGKGLLRALGVAVPEGRVVDGAAAAAPASVEIGMPVALKLVEPEVAHKSEAGGVAGPFRYEDDVRDAARRMDRPRARGFLVERWIDEGVPCFVGLTLHGPFGPLVSFGLGGVWVELLRDVAHRLAPVSEREARAMATTLRASPLLLGARGRPPVDLAAVAVAVSALSRVAADPRALELIDELDVNPLLARADAPAIALDATVVLRATTGRT